MKGLVDRFGAEPSCFGGRRHCGARQWARDGRAFLRTHRRLARNPTRAAGAAAPNPASRLNRWRGSLASASSRNVISMRDQTSAPAAARVADLRPDSRNVNLLVRVLRVGAPQRIPDRVGGGPDKLVAEAFVGDETGNVLLSLWNDEIGSVRAGDSIQITGAYVRLVRGRIRVCLPRGVLPVRADAGVEADGRARNLSDEEHPDEFQARAPRRVSAPPRARWG